jgi:hypothetical protein
MPKWDHCAVYVALYQSGTGGGPQEILSVRMPGQPRKDVVNPLGVIGLLNELGHDGWELVDVEESVFFLKRRR